MIKCPDCNGFLITDNYRGESICEQCGLICSEKAIDFTNFEKKIYTHEDARKKAHTGVYNHYFIAQPQTKIMLKKITDKNFKRIAKWDTYFKASQTRNLITAIQKLKQISSSLCLPYHVNTQAISLYRKALKKDLIMGRTITGMLCACIFYTCRVFKIPISIQEIANIASIDKKELQRRYLFLAKEFNLKAQNVSPAIYVSKYINKFNLTPDIEQKIFSVLTSLPSTFICGKNPKCILGAILYLVCKRKNITLLQWQISETLHITETSIRNHWKKIEKFLS